LTTRCHSSAEQGAPVLAARSSSINPATNRVVAEICLGVAADIEAAVDAAIEAQREWWRRTPWECAQAMWAWGGLIERDAKRLAETDVQDTGKTLNDALPEAGGAMCNARYWSGAVERLVGYQIPTLNGHLSYTKREPLGVVAIILPWNGPTATLVARTAPAVACGNAVVIKPSEYSPRSAGILAELSVEAGMPPGLINVVPGDGSTGALLTVHHGVDGVSFTGSVNTGRKVAQAAVGHFAKPLMELGGKAPNIVFADADIDAAIRGSIWGVFQNAGQICVASTRLLVAADVAEEFTARLASKAKNVRVGDPFQRESHIGPVVSERQYDRVVDYIQIGQDEGATILTGGGSRPEETDPNGFFVRPTVFSGVTPAMRIASEEIFGPVLSILTFDDESEAIELANELDYGLSANIWTKDLDRALRLAEEVQAGNIWVNSPRIMDPSLPFGGFKNSGIGNANGFDVLEELTQTKRVSINYAGAAPGWSDLDGPAGGTTD
jgi:acyl-CoA reductase-like NAD-dependent aldehyde dehydrogenase